MRFNVNGDVSKTIFDKLNGFIRPNENFHRYAFDQSFINIKANNFHILFLTNNHWI